MTWWLVLMLELLFVVDSCANDPSKGSTARHKGWISLLSVFLMPSFPFCSHSSSPPETSESFASVFLESWQQTSALFPMMFAALSLVSSEFSRSKLWGSLFIVGYGSYTAISRVGGSYPKAAKLPLERTWVEWCRMWIYRSCNAFIQEESGQTSNSYHSKSGNGDENGEDQIFFGL